MHNAPMIFVLIAATIVGVSTARAENWHDPSPHQIRFVTVQPDVKIETLDWGGTGRPLVLIAGAGGTAHAFDDFVLLLTPHFHVYGVTRRGYGNSSRPRSGYGIDRLGDDVVAVIRKLNLQKPILMGHSFGGQEVSDVATRYPTLIAGAIYLDAMYTYDAASDKEALYWNVEWKQQIEALQKHLAELAESPFDSRAVAAALRDRDLPAVQKIAENLVRVEKGRPPWVDPQPADLESFPAMREWYHRITRLYLPEAEFRQMQATRPNGRPSSETRAPDWVNTAILAGRKAFHHILVPALYIGAEDNVPAEYDKNDPEARANAEAFIAYQHGWIERRTYRFTSDAPNGHLVILKGAKHMVFASNPQDVVRESLSFADSLSPFFVGRAVHASFVRPAPTSQAREPDSPPGLSTKGRSSPLRRLFGCDSTEPVCGRRPFRSTLEPVTDDAKLSHLSSSGRASIGDCGSGVKYLHICATMYASRSRQKSEILNE